MTSTTCVLQPLQFVLLLDSSQNAEPRLRAETTTRTTSNDKGRIGRVPAGIFDGMAERPRPLGGDREPIDVVPEVLWPDVPPSGTGDRGLSRWPSGKIVSRSVGAMMPLHSPWRLSAPCAVFEPSPRHGMLPGEAAAGASDSSYSVVPERIDVRPVIQRCTPRRDLLGRHLARGVPDELSAHRHSGLFENTSQAEIVDAQFPIGRQKQVGWFDVPVNDTAVVGMI